MNCEFENCNRESGHPGPHGFEVTPGLIFAPHGGGEGKQAESAPVSLKCDCCGTAMTMRRYDNGGGRFTCQCGQRWEFQPGHTTSVVIARLYPSAMEDESPLYQEFLDYQVAQFSFQMEASVLCGLLDQQEATRKLSAFQEEVATVRREIARRKRSWWQRIVGLWERQS